MAQQLNNEGFDTGSNYGFGDKLFRPNFPRSRFDLSHTVHRDLIGEGLVFPISIIEALPASDYEISCQHLMRALPQVVPLLTRQRLYLYAFYSRCSDLWSGFQTFIRKGNSGNVVKQVPVLSGATNHNNSGFTGLSSVVAGSLSDFFGMAPIGQVSSGSGSVAPMQYVSLPYMMYTRIWRDYFLNRNFFWCDDPNDPTYSVKNLAVLPEDDSHFRLNDNGVIQSMADNNIDTYFDFEGSFTYNVTGSGTDADPYVLNPARGMTFIERSTVPSGFHKDVFVVSPFYHDYPADYFTSALPWAQRGNTPTLDVQGVINNTFTGNLVNGSNVDLFSVAQNVSPSTVGDVFYRYGLGYMGVAGTGEFPLSVGTFIRSTVTGSTTNPYWSNVVEDPTNISNVYVSRANRDFNNWFSSRLAGVQSQGTVSSSLSGFKITVEDLRELSISQTILEKMARTDGSYREFGLTFFGEVSKAAVDYRPTFIGGSYSPIIYSEVIQQSQSTETSPLGAYAGHGFSSSAQTQSNGYLGRFHSDDYGYIMILGCVMPDVEYSQGLDKMWTRVNQEQYLLPERTMLGMQPIYNKELFLQANSVVDSDGQPVNNGLWAWQDIFDEYRYKANRIGGKLSDPTNKSFYPWTQSRYFTSLPNWGPDFARASDVRRTQLAATNESEFVCTFDIGIRAVLPLPYQARPASLINGQVG